MKINCLLIAWFLSSCSQPNFTTDNCKSTDFMFASALRDKQTRERQSQYTESIRPTVIFFHKISEILKNSNATKEQRSRYVSAALREFEKLAEYEGGWTGEHAGTGVFYLRVIIDSLGDDHFSQLLSGSDLSRIRAMLIWADVVEPHYKKTLNLLAKEKRQNFRLFSGYGFQIPVQWIETT